MLVLNTRGESSCSLALVYWRSLFFHSFESFHSIFRLKYDIVPLLLHLKVHLLQLFDQLLVQRHLRGPDSDRPFLGDLLSDFKSFSEGFFSVFLQVVHKSDLKSFLAFDVPSGEDQLSRLGETHHMLQLLSAPGSRDDSQSDLGQS